MLKIQAYTCDFDSPFSVLALGHSASRDCSAGKSSASKSRGGLQQFTCRQNAAQRNFPCSFKSGSSKGVSVTHCLVWEHIKANLQCICTQEAPCVSVANLQYLEFSLNAEVMMLPQGVIGPSSPSSATYFHLHFCIGIGFWHPMVSWIKLLM